MRILIALIMWGCLMSPAWATTDEEKSWQTCTSQETGVSFKCDPAWKLSRLGKTLKVTISEKPLVEMDVAESDLKIRFTSELNKEALESFGRYEKGFHVERASVCDRETVKVNGYLKGHPNVRVSDFYLVDHQRIHMVRFTVDPKEAWEDNSRLVRAIVDHLTFARQKQNIKLITKETDENCTELITEIVDGGKE